MLIRNLTGLIFLFILFTACDESGDGKTRSTANLPSSSSSVDEVLVVADYGLLENHIRKPLEDSFNDAYEVLPQYEPKVDANFIAFRDFSKLLKRSRNIVFYVDLLDDNAMSNFVVEMLGDEATAKVLNNGEQYYELRTNMWAKPQLVFFVFAAGKDKLIEKIEEHNDDIISIIQRNDLPLVSNIAFLNGNNFDLANKIKAKYGLDIPIPSGFFESTDEGNFLWMRQDLVQRQSDILYNIMIDEKPIAEGETEQDWWYAGHAWRDSLGKQYISTNVEDSYMSSDTILKFVRSKVTINGYPVFITRGLWKMNGAYMGGPFVNYVVVDENRGKKIMIDAFLFAAGTKKKPHIRRLEAVISDINKAQPKK